MLKEIEKELVTYFNIKIKKLNFDYEIPDHNLINLNPVALCLEARRQMHYERIDDTDDYEKWPINFITINLEGVYNHPYGKEERFRLIFEQIYLHLDEDATKIVEIKQTGGILKDNPSFHELIDYLKYCVGMRRKDFEDLLDKLKLVNISNI